MGKYTQARRHLQVTSKAGADALLLVKVAGGEAVSELFSFRLDFLAEQPVAFEQLVGQAVTVTIAPPQGSARYINGMVRRFSRGLTVPAAQGNMTFTRYHAELVPRFWLLTRRVQLRFWQQMSVPAILQQLLKQEWQLDIALSLTGSYLPRDRVVQYRESDFAFACRLMEQEGIHYYFEHSESGHQMMLTDHGAAAQFPQVTAPTSVPCDEGRGGIRQTIAVTEWELAQEVRSQEVTLWDHCFELPGNNLQAQSKMADRVAIGQESHTLPISSSVPLEIYDYPGDYSQWYDGINLSGGAQAAQLQNIFSANVQQAKVRVQQETAAAVRVQGAGRCLNFQPGHQFTLTNCQANDGPYLLTRVEHSAELEGAYLSDSVGAEVQLKYDNRFQCVPAALPFRPQAVTPRPRVQGLHTATVVGQGAPIFCDKYGRVKVQFHWDRQGKNNADSSCWLRVAQGWAGQSFGMLTLPRVGQEVVVAFIEGDPDKPIVVGSVYNGQNMPPFELPNNAHLSALKSQSLQGSASEYSGLVMNDQLGQEAVRLHAEKDMTISAENDKLESVGATHTHQVGKLRHVTVGKLPAAAAPDGTSWSVSPGAGGSGSGGGLTDAPAPTNLEGANILDVVGLNMTNVGGANMTDVGGGNFTIVTPINMTTVLGANITLVGGFNVTVVAGWNINVQKHRIWNWTNADTYNFRTDGDTYNLSTQKWETYTVGNIVTGSLSSIKLDATTTMTINSGGLMGLKTLVAMTLEAGATVTAKTPADMQISSGLAMGIKAGGTLSVEAGVINVTSPADVSANAGAAMNLEATGDVSITSGGVITLEATDIVLRGNASITLEVGGATITLYPANMMMGVADTNFISITGASVSVVGVEISMDADSAISMTSPSEELTVGVLEEE